METWLFKSLGRTVTFTRELISIYMCYLQGDGVNTSLSGLSFYLCTRCFSCPLVFVPCLCTVPSILCIGRSFFIFFIFFNLTYSRWTSSLPSCLWSQRIFPSLPGSRLTIFYRDASPALLQLVNQWWNFSYSRSHAFRYERKNTNPTLVRMELTTSVLADVQLTY